MKHYILTFLCLVIMAIPAGSKLRVLNVTGQVSVNDAAGTHAAEPYEYVDNNTVIQLTAGSKLSILDEKTKAVYHSPEKTGKMTVRKIIRQARRNSDNTTAAVARKVMEVWNHDTEKRTPRKGVSYRDQSAGSGIEGAVAGIIRKSSAPENPSLRCRVVREETDSLWHFMIENDGSEPMFVNIVKPGSGDTVPSLMLPVGYDDEMPYILVGLGQTELTQYVFYGAAPDDIFLVGVNQPFDTNLVNVLLRQDADSASTADAPAITLNKIIPESH